MSFEYCSLQSGYFLITCDDLSNYTQYENFLYSEFQKTYDSGDLYFKGIPVKMKYYPPEYTPKSGFYHLICENYDHTGDENDRSPNLLRCSHLLWARELIEYCSESCESLYIWENERRGKKNILLYCPEVDYVVVLGKRKDYLLLITAYPIEYDNKRKDLIREYNEYVKTNNASQL